MFELLTSVSYWVLTVLWMVVLALYLVSRKQARSVDRTVTVLLTILSIDAFRTLFESVYFGVYFNSLYGFIPRAFFDVLGQPHFVIVPKIVNVLAGLIVLFILIRSWIPARIREKSQSDDKLRLAASVFTHSQEGIVIASAQGNTLEVNDAFTQLSGYSREELLGRNLNMHKSGEHPDSFYAELWSAVRTSGSWSGQIWNQNKSGRNYPARLNISSVTNELGEISSYVCLYTDITTSVEQQRQLEHIAHFDVLTGLPNRTLLADRLSQAILQCGRRGKSLAVLFLDLDGFKRINDDFGHAVGDQVLLEVAGAMGKALREVDTLSRFGGDEFVAVLPDLDGVSDCEPILNRLLKAVEEPIRLAGDVLELSASIGVTLYPRDSADAEQLIRHADQAMYLAKGKGKNCYQFFDSSHDADLMEHLRLQEDIKRAILTDQFVLHFQPVIELASGKAVGVEALIRWAHPEGELLPPATFLGSIENSPIAAQLGEWVINAALTQMEAWKAAGIAMTVSINVDGSHLQRPDFADQLAVLLKSHPDADPGNLILEILETSALYNIDRVAEVMGHCTALGVSFAIDDFGTGYSSLTYLRRLPATKIKIDQSFIRDMLEDPSDFSIVEGVISLARSFRRKVVAEGVETEEHCQALLALGCDLAQGYGIAKPMPAENIPLWMQEREALLHSGS
jgi:diguanylate cyclase (GGDEF)-like protein/PAS domain S-box-containing protein